jgi:polyhydroxybutyrate depolymerase
MIHCLTRHRFAIGALVFALFLVTACQRGTTGSATTATTTTGASSTIVATPIVTTGCGKTAPIAAGTSATQTLTSGGLARTYILHVPAGYQPDKSLPLVLDFHGHTSTDSAQEGYSQFSPLADQQGFLVVYPQGTIGPDHQTGWGTYGASDPKVNDVLFVSDLITKVQGQLCVDAQRIFATGISNGGGMTNLLACAMAGRIAAFAPVSGAFYPIPGGCQPSRPAPMMEFHGTSDPLVFYNGRPLVQLPPIPTWLQGWATLDGCTSGPTTFFQQADVTGEQWSGCKSNSAVIHYRIQGGGHTWPGAIPVPVLGATTHTINATMLMWQFFQAHPLQGS